jgi:N-acetylmuramoyl-L-alanine amidase
VIKMVQIVKDYVQVNPYTRPGRKNYGIRGIVEHYTASPRATAKNIRDYFNGTCINIKRYAGCQYAVDKHEIRQLIPDNEVAYHAHDNSRCYPKELGTNANFTTIGIEMCIEADGSLHPDTVKNAMKLTAYLLKKYDLPVSRVYRHYDITGKSCPLMWVKNPSEFTQFKKDVEAEMNPVSVASGAKTYTMESGDTLWGISQSTGVSVEDLKKFNPDLNVTAIPVGTVINLVQPSRFYAYNPVNVGQVTRDVWTQRNPYFSESGRVAVKQAGKSYKVYGKEGEYYKIGANEWINDGYFKITPAPSLADVTLKYGDRGEAVKLLQKALNKVYFRCEVDGIFGKDTLDALKRFQIVHVGNPIDGVFAGRTKTILLKKVN